MTLLKRFVVIECPTCGELAKADSNFCPTCGETLK